MKRRESEMKKKRQNRYGSSQFKLEREKRRGGGKERCVRNEQLSCRKMKTQKIPTSVTNTADTNKSAALVSSASSHIPLASNTALSPSTSVSLSDSLSDSDPQNEPPLFASSTVVESVDEKQRRLEWFGFVRACPPASEAESASSSSSSFSSVANQVQPP